MYDLIVIGILHSSMILVSFLLCFVLVSLVARSGLYIVVVVLEMLWIHQVLSLYLFRQNYSLDLAIGERSS